MSALELTLLYLLAAVLGVVGCRMLKLPPMLGYLAVGVLIGGVDWATTGVLVVAEAGVPASSSKVTVSTANCGAEV